MPKKISKEVRLDIVIMARAQLVLYGKINYSKIAEKTKVSDKTIRSLLISENLVKE